MNGAVDVTLLHGNIASRDNALTSSLTNDLNDTIAKCPTS